MEGPFNPNTHREDCAKVEVEKEKVEISQEIPGDKTKEEFQVLSEKRKVLERMVFTCTIQLYILSVL